MELNFTPRSSSFVKLNRNSEECGESNSRGLGIKLFNRSNYFDCMELIGIPDDKERKWFYWIIHTFGVFFQLFNVWTCLLGKSFLLEHTTCSMEWKVQGQISLLQLHINLSKTSPQNTLLINIDLVWNMVVYWIIIIFICVRSNY